MTAVDPPGLLHFDSALLPPADRFARYRDLYGDGADVVQTAPDFAVRIVGWQLDGVGIFERRLHGIGHVRDRRRAGGDGFDHIVLTLVHGGLVEFDVGQGWFVVPPGGGMVADTLLPGRNRMTDARIFTVRIVRERFPITIGNAGLHGRLLPPDRTRLLIDYVEAVTARIDDMAPGSAGYATEALFALVAGAIGMGPGDGDTPAIRRDAARLARVHALIDAMLDDPTLDPAAIVARSELSRATLYRLFKSSGGLAATITARRLDRLQAMLNDAADDRSFADMALACGFGSEAHASRLFRQRHGIRPGQYRRDWNGQPAAARPLRTMRYLDGRMK